MYAVRMSASGGTYSLIDGPEEVDLILKSINSGLQLHLVHVGSIDILKIIHKQEVLTTVLLNQA